MSKPLYLLLLLGLLTGLIAAEPAKPALDQSALIRQRIDALLLRRRKPESLPTELPNPFALAGAGSVGLTPAREPVVPGGPVTPPAPGPAAVTIRTEEEPGSANTAELLARLASRLRITGVIRVKDQLHIIINDNPWKEGDSLVINQGARILRLQVVRIQPGQLTLRLEDAELVLRF